MRGYGVCGLVLRKAMWKVGRMPGSFVRLALVCVSVIGAVVLAAGGAAGNRSAEATFEAFPGPARVTYAENIAYRATFTNIGGSRFTKVVFRQSTPVANGQPAILIDSTCPPGQSTTVDGEFRCEYGSLEPGTPGTPQRVITVVWQVPTLGLPGGCSDCLTTRGRWTIKEGVNDPADPNDAFPEPAKQNVSASLLSAGAGTQETLRAGGYETASASCAGAEPTGNLRTNPVVSIANPVSTTICLPAFSPKGFDLGYASTITEFTGNPRRSEVCIAELGTNCGATYDDAEFTNAYVTHIFRVAAAALEKNERITQVSHNGTPVPSCPSTDPNGCVVSIELDRKTKIWTIIAQSPSNGLWGWP